jgi:hypothetical protein
MDRTSAHGAAVRPGTRRRTPPPWTLTRAAAHAPALAAKIKIIP